MPAPSHIGQMSDQTSAPVPTDPFLRQLVGDVILASERLATEDVQSNRRDLIRATFAAIEGATWTMREHVRQVAAVTGDLSATADLALRELTFHVDEKGRVIEQVRFLTLPTVIRLTINQAQLLDATYEPVLNDAGWECLRRAIGIRHRITHPKTEADLFIADADLSAVNSAFPWLLALVQETMLRTTVAAKHLNSMMAGLLQALRQGDPTALALYHRELGRSDETP